MKIKGDTRRKTRKQMMLAGTVGVTILVLMAGCSTSKRSRAVAKQQTVHEPNVGLVTEVTQVSSAGVETSVSWAGYTPEVIDKMHVTEVAYRRILGDTTCCSCVSDFRMTTYRRSKDQDHEEQN